MNRQSARYVTLLLLIIIFAAPGLAAYLFYQHPSWLGSSRTNKGVLLNPPVVLSALQEKNKWGIIYWEPNACDTLCMKRLDALARVRLALGRKLYQVDQWLILGDKATPLTPETQNALKELDFHVTQLSAAEIKSQGALLATAAVFLADPNNYLILSYPSALQPNDVYKDLKLLLNTKEKNG